MPSTSKKQRNFMAAVAHSPAFAKKVGVPMSVGKEFNQADKGRKFAKGGDMKHEDVKMDKAMVAKAISKHAAKPASKAHKGLKAGGFVKAADGIAKKGKTKATQVKMCGGGMTKKK
jgi:hypothetical protein